MKLLEYRINKNISGLANARPICSVLMAPYAKLIEMYAYLVD